ncbi:MULTISPECIES: hypothetical protein [Polymorphospora]|uniref:Uncharacterized protein n=1 Tax=Polymorphospora lycopeni TaxID=3140240 RepID=A0ABV5CRA1_9ACTN
MSFDLVVWALDATGATAANVRAAHESCRRGEHRAGPPDRRILAFHAALTASYPERAANSPWAVTPLHLAADHLEMNLTETCADEVLLTVERLAGVYGLLLFDPQDGSVYPPPATVGR